MDESLRRDRLSELPDSLILEILSLLGMGDVVRTTILSKRWKDLWTTVPCLDFFDSSESMVRGALAKWKGTKILKFSIGFWEDYPSSRSIADSWLLVPIEKQVEDLCLYVANELDDYRPPRRLYSCSSLTKLFIGYCRLKIVDNVQWYQLKSLMIENLISFSEDVMNRILSGAPLLEELVLLSLDIIEDFSIRSTSLKMLVIGRSDCTCFRTVVEAMLRIWAPNLLSLEISGCVYATCLLDAPSLSNATLCFEDSCPVRFEYMAEEDFPPLEMFDKMFRSISHVEKVTLSSLCIQSLLNFKEDNMIMFSNTKFLKLYPVGAKEMLDVLEMFPQLMTLVVELHEKYYDDTFKFKKPEVDVFQSSTSKATFIGPFLHQLKTVEICWCACDASILSAIEILLHNARLLDKMVFRPKWSGRHRCNRKLWLKAKEKVKCMPRSSPTAKVVVHMSSLEGTRI